MILLITVILSFLKRERECLPLFVPKRYYVTSDLGVQVFDPTGRPCGVLPKVDNDQPLTTCMLAGPDHSTLYIAHGKKIYRRKLTMQKKK